MCPAPTVASVCRRVLNELRAHGLLLESNASFPNVVTLIVGVPIRGSWWGYPQGHLIYEVGRKLASHSGVLMVKLVSGKETYVHRSLWAPLLAIATAREQWQLQGLSPEAATLLDLVTTKAMVQTDLLVWPRGSTRKPPGEAARELERRLLVYSRQIHTRTGAHAKRLETWERWATRVGFRLAKMAPDRAKYKLEALVTDLNRTSGAKGRLPWR